MFGVITPEFLLTQLLTNPAFQGAAGALVLLLLKAALGVALDKFIPARKAAQAGAHLNKFIKEKVIQAEKAGLLDAWTGDEKAVFVMTEIEKFLETRGIKGDASLVTLDWARAQMEMIRSELYPSKN
jgi:hypothetical protein